MLTSFLRDLGEKADHYADHMFEEDESIDKKEVRRLERLIPGTDREEVDDTPPPPGGACPSGRSASFRTRPPRSWPGSTARA